MRSANTRLASACSHACTVSRTCGSGRITGQRDIAVRRLRAESPAAVADRSTHRHDCQDRAAPRHRRTARRGSRRRSRHSCHSRCLFEIQRRFSTIAASISRSGTQRGALTVSPWSSIWKPIERRRARRSRYVITPGPIFTRRNGISFTCGAKTARRDVSDVQHQRQLLDRRDPELLHADPDPSPRTALLPHTGRHVRAAVAMRRQPPHLGFNP